MNDLTEVNHEERKAIQNLQDRLMQAKDDKQTKKLVTEMTLIYERAHVRQLKKNRRFSGSAKSRKGEKE
ncbi:hypothetical protein [Halalkalibacter urbisdiaboli]|uniref:hypothetical protein n=1 Tax=Halalkalibacter urbisdiaboli TaxID=1960589 RepID=UPI000B4322E4|nr:hypothetical protein [Halalkalibacter urbisdiaboli]